MKTKDLIILWLAGFGIPASILENPRFTIPFDEGDPVDSLRGIQRIISDMYLYPNSPLEGEAWIEANRAVNNPKHQLEFLSFFKE